MQIGRSKSCDHTRENEIVTEVMKRAYAKSNHDSPNSQLSPATITLQPNQRKLRHISLDRIDEFNQQYSQRNNADAGTKGNGQLNLNNLEQSQPKRRERLNSRTVQILPEVNKERAITTSTTPPAFEKSSYSTGAKVGIGVACVITAPVWIPLVVVAGVGYGIYKCFRCCCTTDCCAALDCSNF